MDLITEQKLERRRRILEGARTLIAERGFGGITVRDLARTCRVSVPTLYNLFGGKDALLAAAVEEHFLGLLESAPREGAGSGHLRLLAILSRIALEVTRHSGYNRALLRAFAEVRETEPVQLTIAESLAAELAGALEEMREKRQLAAWVDSGALASQITAVCINTTVIWARGMLPDEAVEAGMTYPSCMLALAAARGAARKALEDRAQAAQQVLISVGVVQEAPEPLHTRAAGRRKR